MAEFTKTLVLDNGAYQLKYGYADNVEGIRLLIWPYFLFHFYLFFYLFDIFVLLNFCSIAPNAVMKAKNDRKRVYIANEIETCKDLTGLFYGLPFQKVTNAKICEFFWRN